MCDDHCDCQLLQEIIDEIENNRPIFPAPGFRVFVSSTGGEELRCKEFPVLGWRVCEEKYDLCLHIAQSDPPDVRCICQVQNAPNVLAVKVVYPSASFNFDEWRDRQHKKFIEKANEPKEKA
jgi:hypothetical protein